ncbi:membrane fusion protein, multidrug efflux system [Pseudovibrio denitrificans]|uniref:Membrane fusion protein, multidrug efflux system n=1 Tax=Pseudovibrio denitrificans TaxID=258256 RepID=A0A1I6YK42_9HYPH|nr:efflux RND transporter periplasmic adaptor subunit [Pseudovibrio denitrificans]SFT50856.1 membrane fusion protein, multidrug efflux system [Pseudovibrio denitrificans]
MTVARWFFALLAITGLVGGLGYIKFTQITEAIAQAALIPEHSEATEAVYPQSTLYAPQTQVIGEVVAPKQVELRTEISGRVVNLGFKPGDWVEKHQLLVQMDVSEETAELAAAEADVELAAIKFERAQKLRSTGSGSQSALDNARALLDTSKAKVGQIKSRILKKTIRAPFAGKTNTTVLSVGEFLGVNELITQVVGDTDDIWIDFKLPQHQMELAIGDEVTAIGADAKPVTATVIHRDAAISTSTRTRVHRATVSVSDLQLIHGAFVEVLVPAAPAKDYSALPSSSIQSDSYGQFVYALAQDEQSAYRATRKDIADLQYLGETVLIGQGISQGDLIATDGGFKLSPGMLVELITPQTQQQISSAISAGKH